MHIERGLVTEVAGDYVQVESAPSSACSNCGAKGSCLVSSSGKMKSISILNTVSAKKNDIVDFKIEEKGVIISSLLLYAFPVVSLVAGLVTGSKYNLEMGLDKDGAAAIGAIVGFILSLIVIKIITQFFNKSNIFAPGLLAIVDDINSPITTVDI